MKKSIILGGSILCLFCLLMIPNISAMQYQIREEDIKSKIELEIEEIRNYSNNVIESLINLNLGIIKNILIIILLILISPLLYIYFYIASFIGLMPLWPAVFYYYLTEFLNLPENLANILSPLFGLIWGIAFSFFAPFVGVILGLYFAYLIP